MSYTLTFSERAKGWTSFFSYEPERMIGMNSYFYSFKNGNLFKHNSTDVRNIFYNVQYGSTLTGVFNLEPDSVKNFKTISLDSTDPWTCTLNTDLDDGSIDSSYFSLKEGNYFSYIRRLSDDISLDMRSAKGIGYTVTVNTTQIHNMVFTFGFDLDNSASVGDVVYVRAFGEPQKVGPITNISRAQNTITVDGTGGYLPSSFSYVVVMKNAMAESYGARGYYMQFNLQNNNTNRVELFSVGSSIFKSNP